MDININTTNAGNISRAEPIEVPKGTTLLRDRTLDRLEQATGEGKTQYTNRSNDPTLPNPNEANKAGVMQEETSTTQLTNEYEKAVAAGIKEKVADKAAADKMSRAFFALDAELADSDPLLAAIMNDAQENVNTAFKRNKDAPIPRSKEKQSQMGQNFKEAEVISQMKKYPSLFLNGQLTDKGHQMLRAIMTGNSEGDNFAEQINKAANAALGFTPPVDADSFNAKIGLEFEKAFRDQLSDLSPQEQKRMEYLFNMEPNNPDIKAFLDKAKAQMEKTWGPGVPLVTENLTFTYKINGEYQMSLDENIKKLANLTNGEIKTIKDYLIAKQNGTPFEISNELKAIGDKAQGIALGDVQLLYGVPKSWGPDTSITLNSFLKTAQAQAYQALVDQVAVTEKVVHSIPASPEKVRLIQMLKIISEALSELKSMLFAISASDAAQAADMSRAQVAMVKDKEAQSQAVMDARKKEAAEQADVNSKVAENAEKQKIMGPLMIAVGVLLTVISIVVTALSFGATAGLIALAIAVVILLLTYIPSGMTDKDSGKSLSLMNVIMNSLNWGIDKLCGDDPMVKAILGTTLRVALIVGAIAGGIGSGQIGLVAPLITTFIMESGFVQKMTDDIVAASGAQEPPKWLSAVINGVLAITVVLACVFAKSANSSSMKELKNLSAMEKLGYASKGIMAVNTALTATASIMQAQNQFELADLKKALAKSVRETSSAEAKIEEIETMIKMLQKVLDSLYGHIDEVTDWAKTTGQQMDQRWADKTAMMSDLNNAS